MRLPKLSTSSMYDKLIYIALKTGEVKKALILLESDTVVCDNTTAHNVILGSTGTKVKV